ncbi:MAG: TIGR00725 family protein [Candidatus Roizmanbacteria bacterium]|nr:TIGR00725 family protein [Candidatus Roizmanbacteria bacterium]
MRKIIIGVMGPGKNASEKDKENAFTLGQMIAEKDWILLTGGRNAGVMDASSKGAKDKNGLTIGIIPTKDNEQTSEFVDVSIITAMGSARNNINVLSSNVVIACGMEAGTASEVAMAIKADRDVILLTDNEEAKIFFKNLRSNKVSIVNSPQEAIKQVSSLLNQ